MATSEDIALSAPSVVRSSSITIEGMTCMSCVQNIERNISVHTGVESIRVSLEGKLARVKYYEDLTSPAAIAEAICDMGFDASPANSRISPASGGPDSAAVTAKIRVEGMTCQSCVRLIEGNVSGKPGVLSISVSLEDKEATVAYDSSVTCAQVIREHIDDMGFEAALPPTEDLANGLVGGHSPNETKTRTAVVDSSIPAGRVTFKGRLGVEQGNFNAGCQKYNIPNGTTIANSNDSQRDEVITSVYRPTVDEFDQLTKRGSLLHSFPHPSPEGSQQVEELNGCTISIQGMTSNSCVKNIESTISEVDGVASIQVSLECRNAMVQYISSRTSPEQIANKIDDMGFDASAISNDDPQQLPDADRDSQRRTVLTVKGMHCRSCVKTIEGCVSELSGVFTVVVSLKDETCEVVYNPGKVSPATLVQTVASAGEFTVSLGGQ